MRRRRQTPGPLGRDYRIRELIAGDIRDQGRPLTERERETADKLEDEAAALRDLEREQSE